MSKLRHLSGRHRQSGHLSTYLMPWIAGAVVLGGISGLMVGGNTLNNC